MSEQGLLPPASAAGDVDSRRSPWRWLIPLLIVVLILAAVGWWVARQRASSTDSATSAPTTVTALVTRTDLTETTSYDGVLTFADARTIASKSAGTVTALPASGATVKQGGVLYEIDATPTVLMYGTVPMYRTLQTGVTDGADVKQLEQGLKSLGYDPDGMTVNAAFGSATVSAINAWKASLGLTEDGTVTPAEVQFLPEAIRVQSLSAVVGDSANVGSSLYSASGTQRIATVSLAASDSTVAKVGVKVKVNLPSGESVPGTVSQVNTVASTSSSSSGGGGSGGGGGAVNQQGGSSTVTSTKVAVTVSVEDPKATDEPDQTPVTVAFRSDGAKGVLAVPATALIALAGGGFAVEVVDASGATHLVAVEPGLFAVGGLVEVKGDGIEEGATVVVPSGA